MFKITFSTPEKIPAAVKIHVEQTGKISENYTVTEDNVSTVIVPYMRQGYTVTLEPIFTNNCAGVTVDTTTRGTQRKNV